ncbi:uncharacterized protein N7477_009875 [Penicillium maclennaniae]|uniref:uncharacterized protein n=1 Tax=Penicillium maclennaniae TaxID=1343394 RepID=UPI00254067F9|nr:uncharacterized protein N7477_009875 [Penicillium maclennaniae]KAJ5662259.1 hypothetical protein N7477_009875 [Penicillium maclennaniae]
MAYMIQLSLNKLLYRIKAKPKNDTCGPISYRRLLPSEDRKGILQTPSIGYAGLQYILMEAYKGVFKLYNKLFKYLEALISQLKKKKILIALKAGLQKLRKYYPKANNIYTHSTILALKDKLQYFKRKE